MSLNIQEIYKDFSSSLSKFCYEKDDLVKIIFINVIINGSILVEDLPGIGKTTLSKAISKLLGFDFNRVQGTSDLTPQDIIGGEYYNFNTKEIETRKGPIFTQLLLIDEINRMNPKTQSAFLQAMEEKSISIVGVDYLLDENFFVIATQNPIEHSGTFPLPEAQKDRFYSRISLGMPNSNLQLDILINNSYKKLQKSFDEIKPVLDKKDLEIHFENISNIKINKDVGKRLVDFFNLIKESDKIIYPISQRGIYVFTMGCRANAYLAGRDYIIPKDGEELIETFLEHRLDIDKSEAGILKDLYNSSFRNF